jgi:CTP synthase (UTP-ammonia lyase)
MIRIALIGEFKPEVKAHIAIPRALKLAGDNLARPFELRWIPTLALEEDAVQKLQDFQGLWFVPNTPYASMNGALHAIKFAREQRIPTLGTCGGCQHMIIEYARNVLGLVNADHAESNPEASLHLITPLACSRSEITTTSFLSPDSRVAAIYGTSEITEEYGTCNYGPNASFWPALEKGGMRVSGVDSDGDARIIELGQHPFFVGTLFQPERSAFKQVVHPLIKALLQEAEHYQHSEQSHP